jgi:hypothetical protein
MDSSEKLDTLQTLYTDVSKKLSGELLKRPPDHIILIAFRKQLAKIDRDIRHVQIGRDMWG